MAAVSSGKDGNGSGVIVGAPPQSLGIRHLQVAVMVLAVFVAFAMQSDLNVAIVAMIENRNDTNSTNSSSATFDWDESIQGFVLSSFFWGYLITQIPAGLLSERFGGHLFLCGAIVASSALTLVLPQCAYWGGWKMVCLNRMFQGISQGFVFPCVYTLLGVWAPPTERSTLAGLSVSAQLIGIIVASPVSGYLCSNYGWPSVFYAIGALGAVVSPFLIFLGANSPSKHRLISSEESNYIQSSLGGAKVKLLVPWKRVLTNAPYIAASLTMAFQSLVYITFTTKIPTYLGTVLDFDIADSGAVSALPFLLSWILSLLFSRLCDVFLNRGWFEVTSGRKLFNSISHFGAAASMVLLSYSPSRNMSVVFLTLAIGVQAGSFVGAQSAFVDLAPNFSGAIFSVANFITICLCACGPNIVGYIVTEKGSADQWRIVFYLSAIALVLSNVIFLIWGTSKTQWWNRPDRYKNKEEYEKHLEKDRFREKQGSVWLEQNTVC